MGDRINVRQVEKRFEKNERKKKRETNKSDTLARITKIAHAYLMVLLAAAAEAPTPCAKLVSPSRPVMKMQTKS